MDAWIRTVSFDSQSHHLATTERFYSSFLLGLLTMPSSISSGLLLCQFHLFSDWEDVPNKASRVYLPLCLSWFHLNEQFVCGLWLFGASSTPTMWMRAVWSLAEPCAYGYQDGWAQGAGLLNLRPPPSLLQWAILSLASSLEWSNPAHTESILQPSQALIWKI